MAGKTVRSMTIRVSLDGENDLRFTAKDTRANRAKLVEMFGEPHVIVPRNIWGRAGKPTAKKVAAPKKVAAKPKAKRTTKPAETVAA